jgi:hypothetical protein
MANKDSESASTSASVEPVSSRPYMPGYGVKPANEGGGLLPWSWALERLSAARGYWISTVRPDGAPHCMAVWGVWFDNRFLFSTGAQSRKARNLAENPKCVVSTDRTDQAVTVEGLAEQVTEPSLTAEFCRACQEKYKWDMTDFAEPVFVVVPRIAFAFTESSGEYSFTGSATRWTFA